MENSSSWHRVAPTVVVWQMLAALVFLSVLGRALSLPDTADSRTLCASGLTVWALCLCWEFPQLLDTLLRGGVLARLPDFSLDWGCAASVCWGGSARCALPGPSPDGRVLGTPLGEVLKKMPTQTRKIVPKVKK